MRDFSAFHLLHFYPFLSSKMKHPFKRIYPVLFFLLLASGCIREDQSDCPPSVTRLSFAHTTPCNEVPAYPADIDSLHLFVFDSDDKFTGEHIHSRVRLNAEYFCEIPLSPGKYRIVTWAGTGNTGLITPGSFIKGITTIDEATLYLRKGYYATTGKNDSVLVCTGSLYFGERTVEAGSSHLINLIKNTTGIRVSVSGLNPRDTYRLVISGDDNHYKFDNTFTSSGKLNYIKPLSPDNEGNAQVFIDMLNPSKESQPVISILHTATGAEIFRENLVKLITDRIPEVNFDCTHEFDIDISFKADLSVSVSVNGWTQHEEEGGLR